MIQARPVALRMREAEAYWAARVPLRPGEFAQIAEEARLSAFTVGGVTDMEVLRRVQASLGRAVQDGQSFASWKKSAPEVVEALGLGDKPWLLRTIFQTNIQTAYSVGRFWEMMDNVPSRPWWQYVAVNDSRTRPAHRALNGLVFRYDHPFWKSHYPPNGYNCRCLVRALSDADLRERGLTPTGDDPTAQAIQVVDAETGEVSQVTPGADPGFRTNPALSGWTPDLSKYPTAWRQNFLESILDEACPKDWADFADSPCLARLKRHLNQQALEEMQTLVWARGRSGVEGYADWVEKVLKFRDEESVRLPGEIYPVGNLPVIVTEALPRPPRLSLTVISDQVVLHLSRPAKSIRGAALSSAEIVSIPERFVTSDWYIDQEDPALLMTWLRQGGEWLKVVIRTDRKIGKGVANEIITAGLVQERNVLNRRYLKI